MKTFQIIPAISEYKDFVSFAEEVALCSEDLIITNKYIYDPAVSETSLDCQTLFQEQFGSGEPSDIMVDNILSKLRGRKFHRIIAIGGGTIIDIAKVIAVSSEKDLTDDLYNRMPNGLEKKHPLIIIPTTCGTGSEVTNISIINRTTKGIKQGLVSTSMYANEAVLIPELLSSLPYNVFATSSIDAMIHAVESYLSPKATIFSEMYSEKALSLILSGWKNTLAENDKMLWKKYSREFLIASNWAGIAFGNAGCAAVHATSYPIGSIHHIPHGQSNQLMFQAVMEKYREKRPAGKLNKLESILGSQLEVTPSLALNELYKLMDFILVNEHLHAHNIDKKELPFFAKNVIETQQRLLNNNYVPLTEEDILDIYNNAY